MKLIDLSMEVYKGMMTYPNVAKPVIVEMETHREMAKRSARINMGSMKSRITA